ncbi:triosephosphate isomerase [Striga asiatica]|uniref:Triosephosphate isomerase n=1 Tax=Striga asiatica TaxID=4170 RepID=A0A5A7PKR3_STRAF|nr:triosephosphate isomerase [Striga asiatica]
MVTDEGRLAAHHNPLFSSNDVMIELLLGFPLARPRWPATEAENLAMKGLGFGDESSIPLLTTSQKKIINPEEIAIYPHLQFWSSSVQTWNPIWLIKSGPLAIPDSNSNMLLQIREIRSPGRPKPRSTPYSTNDARKS